MAVQFLALFIISCAAVAQALSKDPQLLEQPAVAEDTTSLAPKQRHPHILLVCASAGFQNIAPFKLLRSVNSTTTSRPTSHLILRTAFAPFYSLY